MSSPASLIPQTEPGKLFQAEVDQRLQQIVDDNTRSAPTQVMREFWQQIAQAIHGGKRTRPMLVNLGFQVAGDAIEPPLIDTACAYELLHTALVIHDDIIDHDFIRRGQPTLSAHYRDAATARGQARPNAEHVGHSAAILAGDVLLSHAARVLTQACRDHPKGAELIDVFHGAILDSAAGELEDVLYSAGIEAPKLNDVLRMHRLKTAAYSFDAPLRAGALLASADEQTVAQLGQIGRLLGSCYQIIDDVLGTFGECSATGKPDDSDLREGKITVLIALAERKPEIASVVGAWRKGDLDNETLRTLLVAEKIDVEARDLAKQCCDSASEKLSNLSLSGDIHQAFLDLIDEMLERNN